MIRNYAIRDAFERVQLKPGDESRDIVKRVVRVAKRADQRRVNARARPKQR